MSLAKPRILSWPLAVFCRYQQCSKCRSFWSSQLAAEAFAGASAKIPKNCFATVRTCGWDSARRTSGCQRLFCDAVGGLKLEKEVVQDVKTDEHTVLPDEFVDTSQSPFAASTQRLRGMLTDSDIWADVKTWVVFSDLHLSRRTSDTCLEVLRTVHSEASSRNAGIIFLGDFWHCRGALPVELLNLAISELQTWTSPTIFIPGNHDQVNVGGEIHALTVLEATNYFIKVISEPTEYLGALWLPFRRDHDVIRDAVTRHSGITAIFGHLDVIGAYMNEQRQASDGVDPSMFPPSLPVFTGHYHKPHVVDGSRVEYIGSPYQVSASETGQTKRFLLLNQQWDKLGEIPVDIGPRHYTLEEPILDSQSIKGFRSGDRVKWLLPTETLSTDVKKTVAKLRREGVHIELIFPSIAPKPRIEKAEDLDAFALFKLYARIVDMSEGATNAALDILHGLNLPAQIIQRPQVYLVLESVEMEGFGPFVEPVRYPLAQRGVRVVSGKNVDSLGADSNGAGKTTLVMAPLWAITGSTDPRPDSVKGLSAAHVVHYKSRKARVQVEGTVNGKPFTIERTTTSKKSTLRFVMDGKDETCQEIKLTQERIDEILNTALLERAVFHGQYGIGGLLEANDKTFKEELSRVVALDIWSQAREQSKADLRDIANKIQQTEGALGQLTEQNKELVDKVKLSHQQLEEWGSSQATKISCIEAEVQATRDCLRKLLPECMSLFDRLEGSIKEWGAFGSNLDQYLVPFPSGAEVSEDTSKIRNLEEHELLVRRSELGVERRNAQAARLDKKSTLDRFQKNVTKTFVCERCLQEIPAAHVSKHMSHYEYELIAAIHKEEGYEREYEEISKKLESLVLATKEEMQQVERARSSQKEKADTVFALVNKIWEAVASAQVSASEAASFLSRFGPRQGTAEVVPPSDLTPGTECDEAILLDGAVDVKVERFKKLVSELMSKVVIGKKEVVKLQSLQQGLEVARNEKNPFAAEYSTVSDLQSKASNQLEHQLTFLEEAKQSAQWLKEVDAAFGHSGIQSYVLEGALAELQERTARFTQAFSGGSLGLLLNSTKQQKSKKGTVDNIEKIAVVRMANGSVEHWALQQLSGGERRRVALALELGYAELVAERGGLHCDLLVLDEVLQHLDVEGKARVLTVLRGLPQGTILLVSQAYSDVAEGFELVDLVVKQEDAATVELAEGL